MHSRDYYNIVVKTLSAIEETQVPAIQQAAGIIKAAIEQGGVLHVFSTGHSHMMVEEMFYRAGGLVPVNPIFDPGTMLHQGAQRSTQFERTPGYARGIFEGVEVKPNEPLIVVSNSGINPVPVEMAELAREKCLKVIAITSRHISKSAPGSHGEREEVNGRGRGGGR